MTRSQASTAKRGLGAAVKTIAGAAAAKAAEYVSGWSGGKRMTITPSKKRKLVFKEQRNPFGIKGKYGLSTAYYRGRVKAKRRKAKSDLQKELYMARGFLQSFEEYGSITDPHCVHVGHSTHSLDVMPAVIAKAVVRRLFSKAGYEIDDQQRVLPLLYSDSGLGFTYCVWGTNPTSGVVEEVERYNTVAGSTLSNIINIAGAQSGGPTFFQLIQTIMSSPGLTVKASNLDRVDLLVTDSATTSVQRLVCSINLRQHKLHVMSKSTIQLQNRSKGASSGDVDATAVDNQPLKGYMYEFGQAAPTTKSQGTLWNKDPVTQKGLIKKTAAQFADAAINGFSSTGWREPQPPGVFNKVIGSRKVLIQPGDIKSGVIVHVYKGYFNDVLQQMAARNFNSPPLSIQGIVKGKSQIWSLEEQINTGLTNDIIVQFECDKLIGAYIKQTRKPLLLMAHNEEVN